MRCSYTVKLDSNEKPIKGQEDHSNPIPTWLLELNPTPLKAGRGENILVLGKLINGDYPIKYRRYPGLEITNLQGKVVETHYESAWEVLGIPTSVDLTREECLRILRSVKQ